LIETDFFSKGYTNNWSEEIFRIAQQFPTYPVTNYVCDLAGEVEKGKFYDHELQSATETDDEYVIQKIFET
jgi:hypothetical protein